MADAKKTPPKFETVEIRYGDKSVTLPAICGTEGEIGIDIGKLRSQTGMITLDPGYMNTGSCQSAVTFIDGEKGILRYRGYDIADLAEKGTFLQVCKLLMEGQWPAKAALKELESQVRQHTMLHEDFKRFFAALPKDAHPMPVLAAAIGALATFYQEPETDASIGDGMVRLIAKMPTLAACSYKHSIGQPFMYPRNELDYTSNFLHMMYATPCEDYEPDPVIAKALDLLLILHADHEQNCSTSTVRLVGSSQANLFASISAGVSALWGPLHGGANQKVVEMLEQISGEGLTADDFVARAKDKQSSARLMGFGHRVYKNYDPRAKILKKACGDVLDKVGGSNELLDIAMRLEEIALSDDYFISRNLYPNVDFYSGVIYKAIGIPTNMFTVMFALGRLPGWMAQWMEMRKDPSFRIGRPRQIYMGATERRL
jgi:citrate synthase